jgi:CHAD domain-containing protein
MEGFANAQVDARVSRVRRELTRTLADPSEDPVHDLRVSIRRLQQSLRLLVCEAVSAPLRASVRPVLKAAGGVRNQDIALGLLAEAALPGSGALEQTLRHDRAVATGALRLRIVQTGTLDTRPLRLTREPGPALAMMILPRLARAYLDSGELAARSGSTWEQMHRFRLVSKQFRYSLEIFGEFYGEGIEERINALRRVQNVLGEGNDCETTAALGPVASLPEFRAWLRRRQRKREQDFRRLWAEEFATRGKPYWVAFLARSPGIAAVSP